MRGDVALTLISMSVALVFVVMLVVAWLTVTTEWLPLCLRFAHYLVTSLLYPSQAF